MDPLEQALSQALRRESPPPEFARRVIAGVNSPRRTAMPRWLATAAAVVVLAGGSSLAWQRHQGELAKQQVIDALRITSGKLHQIQMQVKAVQQ